MPPPQATRKVYRVNLLQQQAQAEMEVAITSTGTVRSEHRSLLAPPQHTVYNVLIVFPDGSRELIARRYSEFLELHDELAQHVPSFTRPAFPAAVWFGRMSRDTIKVRRDMLEEYLRACLRDDAARRSDALARFLCVGAFAHQTRDGVALAPVPPGMLSIVVMEARNLVSHTDLLKPPDPFVVTTFGSRTQRSEAKRHTTNPVWYHRMRVWVQPGEAGYKLSLAVYDKDVVGDNDLLGRVDMPASRYWQDDSFSQYTYQSLPLTWTAPTSSKRLSHSKAGKHDDGPHGELVVRVRWNTREQCLRMFWTALHQVFDHNGDKSLQYPELLAMLESLGSNLSNTDIDNMYLEAGVVDKNEQGISPDQLYRLMTVTTEQHIRQFTKCPVCREDLHLNASELDVQDQFLAHAGLCFADNGTKDFLSAGFITEQAAANNRWWKKLTDRLTKGTYKVGTNTGHILVRDRATGKVIEELMPGYIRMGIRMIYTTRRGRNMLTKDALRLLAQMTHNQGKRMSSPESAKDIPGFIKQYKLDQSEFAHPAQSYKTFNEFFYRELRHGARPIAAPSDDAVIVSPADCRLSVFRSVDRATQMWIKGRHFTIAKLLQSKSLAGKFEAGAGMMIARLAPQDYHRMHFPVSGRLVSATSIDGEYITVNPMAVRAPDVDVFTQNRRVVNVIETEQFGTVAYVCIGATMVGSIVRTAQLGQYYSKGATYGYFAFGGSTIVVLFQHDRVLLDQDLLHSSESEAIEVLVKMGEQIAVAKHSNSNGV